MICKLERLNPINRDAMRQRWGLQEGRDPSNIQVRWVLLLARQSRRR
jgi:hypothetical protein